MNLSRSTLWLLSRLLLLFILACFSAPHAQANGVVTTLGNGEIKYGTVTSTGVDTYSFTIPTTLPRFLISVAQTGAADAHFIAQYEIFDPSATLKGHATLSVRGSLTIAPATAGTWTVKINRTDSPGTTGGNYAVHLVTAVPGAFSITPPNQGSAMYPSLTYGGAIGDTADRGNLGIFNFNGVAGSVATFTFTATGGTGNEPEFLIHNPSGVLVAHTTAGTLGTGTMVAGVYTLMVHRIDANDNVGNYTLTSPGIGMPEAAKSDGTICVACELAKAAKAQQMAAQSYPVTLNGNAAVGDPINIATGNLVESVTDYTTAGANPLAFTRTYNSLSYTRGLYPTLMGPNWRTNYDRYLHVVSSTQVSAERADGRAINFTLIGGIWTPDTDVDVKLTNSGTAYTLTDSDDTVEAYTVASGKGTLNTITLPNGYTQTMNYTTGVLTSVSDSYSRSLSFTYTSGVLTGVTTPDTATLTYGYTTVLSQSLLTSVSYNTSPTTSQTYLYENTSLPFALTGITDENTNRYATWAYDASGRAISSQHAGGADLTQISYDDSTGNRTVTNPLGEQETFKFTTLQGVQKVSEIDRAASSPVAAATRTFTYDTNGYLATATDWDGNSTHWTNNSHGLPTSITEGYGSGVARTTTVVYDTTWVHKPYTTTKTGVTIDDRYDATKGNLLTHKLTDSTSTSIPYSTNGQTRTWTYTYTATGQLQTVTTPRTDLTLTTTYGYTGGVLTTVTDGLSNVTTVNTYQPGGLPTKITDPNSIETDFAYDNRNRLTSKTVKATSGNEVTGYQYYADGQLDILTLPDSSTLTYTYDNAHRLTKVQNTAGETINYTPDAFGDITQTLIKDASSVTQASHTATFDVLGDMLTSVGATSLESTSFAWDGNRNRTSLTDANSKTTGLAWDALSRASTVTDALTHTATPTYDARNNVTNQTDFNGYATAFVFDGFPDSAIQKASPDTGTAVYYYDKDGNQTKRTDGRSVETDRTFDKLERPLTETYPSYSGEAIAYTYDSVTGGNKGIGHLTKVTDESGSTSFTYDNFGNIITEVRVIGTQTYTTSYSYDLANRLKEIIYPSGRYVDYTYNSSGYLTTVTTKPSSGGTVTTLASSVVHKPFGPIASFTYGNTLAQTRTYDANYWLDDLVTANGSTHIQNLTYGFDNAGNLTGITDNLSATRDQTYGVDALNRLHTASGPYGSRTYTYDNNSNRATWYNGTITRTTTNTTSANTIASITDGTNTRHFTWTGSGNMASDDRVMDGGLAVAYTYGGRDRLESLTVSSQPTTYKINALGERVSKATLSATTHYHYDLAHHIIGEANGSTGANQIEYVWMEGMPLAQIDSSGNISYIHPDQVNAPQKITNPSMTIVWDYEIEPFGETYATPTNTTPTNHRFPGQYADIEDTLSYNLNRDYDTTLGRYVQADLTGLRGGYNLYGYVGQNPTQGIDPQGLQMLQIEPPVVGDMVGTTAADSASDSVGEAGADSTPPGESSATSDAAKAASDGAKPTDVPTSATPPRGLPPEGVKPPVAEQCKEGPASRPSEQERGGKSLYDSKDGEWRYSPEDKYHNPHWDYNPHDVPNSEWQNIPIGDLPVMK